MATYYEVLGVSEDADQATITAAYRKAAKAAHPDAGGDPRAFLELSEARRILSSPLERREYDKSLAQGSPPPKTSPSAPGPPRAAPTPQPPPVIHRSKWWVTLTSVPVAMWAPLLIFLVSAVIPSLSRLRYDVLGIGETLLSMGLLGLSGLVAARSLYGMGRTVLAAVIPTVSLFVSAPVVADVAYGNNQVFAPMVWFWFIAPVLFIVTELVRWYLKWSRPPKASLPKAGELWTLLTESGVETVLVFVSGHTPGVFVAPSMKGTGTTSARRLGRSVDTSVLHPVPIGAFEARLGVSWLGFVRAAWRWDGAQAQYTQPR